MQDCRGLYAGATVLSSPSSEELTQDQGDRVSLDAADSGRGSWTSCSSGSHDNIQTMQQGRSWEALAEGAGLWEAEVAGRLPAPLRPLRHVGARTLRATRAPSSEEEGGMWTQIQRPVASPPLVQKSPDSTVDDPHPSLQATPRPWSVRVTTLTWFKRNRSPKNENVVDIYLPSCWSRTVCSYFFTYIPWAKLYEAIQQLSFRNISKKAVIYWKFCPNQVWCLLAIMRGWTSNFDD